MIFGINTTRAISKLAQISLDQRLVKLRLNNFEISLVVFMPNIITTLLQIMLLSKQIENWIIMLWITFQTTLLVFRRQLMKICISAGLTVVCETKRNEMERNEMKICSLRKENL